jgi:hypothetical protein
MLKAAYDRSFRYRYKFLVTSLIMIVVGSDWLRHPDLYGYIKSILINLAFDMFLPHSPSWLHHILWILCLLNLAYVAAVIGFFVSVFVFVAVFGEPIN